LAAWSSSAASAAARARRFWRLFVGGDDGSTPPNVGVVCVASSGTPMSLLAKEEVVEVGVAAVAMDLRLDDTFDAAAGPSDAAMDLSTSLSAFLREEEAVEVGVTAVAMDLRLDDTLDAAAGPSDAAMDAASRLDLPLVALEAVVVAASVSIAVAGAAAAGMDLRLDDALDAGVPVNKAVGLAVEAVEVLGAALVDANSRRATEAEAEAVAVEEVEAMAVAAMGSHGIGAPIHCWLSSAFIPAAGTACAESETKSLCAESHTPPHHCPGFQQRTCALLIT
jgi:hypothetical protein